MSVMPVQKPGRSKQDYATPWNFIDAVESRFGKLYVDLAATAKNSKAPRYITPQEDSLSVDWSQWKNRVCWLNPPYSRIEPWARKCAEFASFGGEGRLLFLTPASVGANWFAKFVYQKSIVIALNGRITFVGETLPYPKDCILSVFGAGLSGFEVWKWD